MATQALFYVWITTVTDAYTEQIVGRLARRSWGVQALANHLSIHNDDNMATVVSFAMSKSYDKDESPLALSTALAEIKDVLKVLGVRYHSIIVSEQCASTWTLGNMLKSEFLKEEEERKKAIN